MEKSKRLKEFEQEYYQEINMYDITEKDLFSLKISPKLLAYEVYLRKVFGDSLANNNIDDYDDSAKRKVEKITKDKLDNSVLNSIVEDIDKSEFDDNLDAIIHSQSKED